MNGRDIHRLATRPQGQLAMHMGDVGKMQQLVDGWNEQDRRDEFNRLTQRIALPVHVRQRPFAREHRPLVTKATEQITDRQIKQALLRLMGPQ